MGASTSTRLRGPFGAAAGWAIGTGAVDRGTDGKRAEEIFDLLEKFAGYGFNKSHAAAYAIVSYQTAYLKAHYPVEYIACLLTSVKGNYEKAAVHLADARAMGITVVNPDINRSESDFTAFTDGGAGILTTSLTRFKGTWDGSQCTAYDAGYGVVLSGGSDAATLPEACYRYALTATDLETMMRVRMDVNDAQGTGKICIPSKILTEYLKNLPEQPITFNVNEHDLNHLFLK